MRVLLTGASGIVGRAVRPYLTRCFDELVLMTHKTLCENLEPNERSITGDIQDRGFVADAVSRVDGIIHLAGLVGPDYTFEQTLGPNIIGTWNLFESARIHGVSQIVYASSHHAIGFLPRGSQIDDRTPIRADSYYGVSKAFGEILAAYFCDKYGMNILSIRIGSVTDKVVDERRLHAWNSPADLARLMELGLKREEHGFRQVYGVSECPEPFFDNSSALAMGYVPGDRSLDNLSDPAIADAVPDLSSLENQFIGGYFASGGMNHQTSAGSRKGKPE